MLFAIDWLPLIFYAVDENGTKLSLLHVAWLRESRSAIFNIDGIR